MQSEHVAGQRWLGLDMQQWHADLGGAAAGRQHSWLQPAPESRLWAGEAFLLAGAGAHELQQWSALA